ncbi:hypothetical protein GCM10028821_44320 [Hymenobacter jeollabukensis]|uniref:Peptidase S8/S53 domain-containing protein n=1 Tax=Hymenobacter jeollabukensis TaxID=2025313 RepID=A0A5R8WJH2_9BACT|nr:hypothetical protein FDY95_21150 [Hymenobacter jeollabukensis]
MDPRTFVYQDGVAVRAAREIIVRFEPEALKSSAINNLGKQQGYLYEFLTPGALSAMSTAAGFNMASVAVGKIFPNLTIADSMQLNRMGETIPDEKLWAVLLLQLPLGTDEVAVCNQLPHMGVPVVYAHLNPVARPASVPNDTEYAGNQRSLHYTAAYPDGHINVEGAWDLTTGRPGIKIGVYDSGIKATHPDLVGVVAGGHRYDMTRPTPYDDDVLGHGTSVAGIIAAVRNNGIGIAGIAGGDAAAGKPGVRLYSYKTIGDGCQNCGATLAEVANALQDGITDGMHIMNHS